MKIEKPTEIKAAGNKPKIIEEFIGKINTGNSKVSIARMRSPGGWIEPFQNPEFDEFSVVLNGMLKVEIGSEEFEINPGQAIEVKAGSRVRYSTPMPEGADYIAVCVPAFTMDKVRRED